MYHFACKDMGYDCPFTADSETKENLMMKVAEHGMSAHNLTEADMTQEMKEKAMSVITEV